MAQAETRDFAHPDEVRSIPKGTVEILHVGGGTVGRMTLQPGWRWSEHVKPLVGGDWCEAAHFQYHIAGTLHVVMEDGAEFDVGPGEVSFLPPRHDAWVVGDDAAVVVDWSGATHYAQPA